MNRMEARADIAETVGKCVLKGEMECLEQT